mgnify:CR=1 FL=1
MIKQGEIIFNGKSSLNMNLRLEKYPTVQMTSEEYEEVPVEGRSGTLILNKGTYPNKVLPFTFTKISDDIDNMDELYDWLTNISDKRLFFGRNDRVYIVKKVVIGNFQKEFISFGNIDVQFICEPFLSDVYENEYIITQSGFSFFYGGTAPSNSLIRVYGNGNVQIIVDDSTMLIKDVIDYVDIDGELMQIRDKLGQSKDLDTTGDFVELDIGKHVIKFSSNITKIEFKYIAKYK